MTRSTQRLARMCPRRDAAGLGATLLAMFLFAACAPAMQRTSAQPPSAAKLAELWTSPGDISKRDLFVGPGGKAGRPIVNAKYKVESFDPSGNSVGYDVVDPKGRAWKVKLGQEVRPEIVASRLLWAIGFHQPVMHLVPNLRLEGGRPEDSGQPARLRARHGYKSEDEWSWHRNPYVGSRQLNGLLVANLMLNNWDLKESQNRIYQFARGASGPRRRFAVQDLGAALGKTAWPVGTRDDIEGFESQNLIEEIQNNTIRFDYHARHKELFERIRPADVVWTARLFSRLTDKQWRDAFRAAGFTESESRRFIAKLKSKVQEGLALETRAALTR